MTAPAARRAEGSRWRPWLLGWLPLWLLFTLLVAAAHGVAIQASAMVGLRMIAVAALLAQPVLVWCARRPWPLRPSPAFFGQHLVAGALHAVAFLLLNTLIEMGLSGHYRIALGPGAAPYLAMGLWLYLVVAGIGYAVAGARRAAASETLAAQARLAALRNQLHPHFLFNALHTVVQLIGLDPRAAQQAGEQLGGLLRDVLEQADDLIPLEREWSVVQRYLALEALRLGERLDLHAALTPAALAAQVPVFALQTLVENAILHGVALRVQPTRLWIQAERRDAELHITVGNDGASVSAAALLHSQGTGLKRLRDRLAALYGGSAALVVEARPEGGVHATLSIPQTEVADD